jgi:hypothetical protein
MRTLAVTAVAAGALVLTPIPAQAQCDSVAGAGWLNTTASGQLAKAHFDSATTEHPQEDFTLGSGGGNIQLFKQTADSFGGTCPALFEG